MTINLSLWLSLREAADHAARSAELTEAVVARLPRDTPLKVLDLGTGTGSNIRYLSRRLPAGQEWLVVDRDAAVLANVAADTRIGAGMTVETRCQNLSPLDAELFVGRHLVTASALLDLVSDPWLQALAERCHSNGAVALFALTYNGDSGCSPVEPEDDSVRALLNRHQKTDKGFGGLSAGPDATESAARAFLAAGYQVRREITEWQLSPDDEEFQRQLIEGWAEAAIELEPGQAPSIRSWLERRLAHVTAHRSRIVVCHEDLAAWPEALRSS